VGWAGQDVLRQIFLYQNGLTPISEGVDLVCALHEMFSTPNSEKIVYAKRLKSNKADVEKAIFRLSNLGVIADWTVDDFFGGVFTVSYKDYTNETIKETLLKFIQKYINDFEFDNHPDRLKYTTIFDDLASSEFEKCVRVLLQWSYDKFGANRRESLKNVYNTCLNYQDTDEGKVAFKKSLEAYFKFTTATYVLQHIAENNNKDFNKWFEVFYNEDYSPIDEDTLIDLEGNLQRFLESHQTNTGLNLINGLTLLLLNRPLNSILKQRLDSVFQEIKNYKDADYDYIIDQVVYKIAQRLNDKGKLEILSFLYKYSKSEEDSLLYAKELGDVFRVLEHYNQRLKIVNKKIADGFKKTR